MHQVIKGEQPLTCWKTEDELGNVVEVAAQALGLVLPPIAGASASASASAGDTEGGEDSSDSSLSESSLTSLSELSSSSPSESASSSSSESASSS